MLPVPVVQPVPYQLPPAEPHHQLSEIAVPAVNFGEIPYEEDFDDVDDAVEVAEVVPAKEHVEQEAEEPEARAGAPAQPPSPPRRMRARIGSQRRTPIPAAPPLPRSPRRQRGPGNHIGRRIDYMMPYWYGLQKR